MEIMTINGSTYRITSAAAPPRIKLLDGNKVSYLPLITGSGHVCIESNGSTYRPLIYTTSSHLTTKDNTNGLLDITELTRSSFYPTSSINQGILSSITALTQSSTSGYRGISSRARYYQTQSNAIGAMSSLTALTRKSVYG